MRTESKRIAGAFQLIGEVLDELSHAEKAWLACGWGRIGAQYNFFFDTLVDATSQGRVRSVR